MKFGFRTPSLRRRIAARTSFKRVVRHSMGFKAPRGMGMITNPKRALYNKIYNKTSFGLEDVLKQSRHIRKQAQDSLSGKELRVMTKEDGSLDCIKCGTNMGQPKIKGIFKKYAIFKCQNCGTTAKMTRIHYKE